MIFIFQQECLLGLGNRKRALEKVGGNQKWDCNTGCPYWDEQSAVPWFLSYNKHLLFGFEWFVVGVSVVVCFGIFCFSFSL